MWGIIADVDIESEKYRWMGSARFTVATIPRILNPRMYPGKLLYLPASDEQNNDKLNHDVCQLPHSACSSCITAEERKTVLAGAADAAAASPSKLKKKKKSKEKGNFRGRAPGLELTSSLSHMPKDISDPVADLPESWKSLDGPFVYFVASNITHISNDVLSTPFAHASDGFVDVVVCKNFSDRTKMLSVFANELESGKYVRHDGLIDYIKAKAILLIPEGLKTGIMDVDGEPFPGAPIAVEIHRGILSFCYPDWNAVVELAEAEPQKPKKRRKEKNPQEDATE